MVKISEMIWTERYRPRKVSDMVGDFKEKILLYLQNPQTVPNFLFHSRHPGTGKTTLAKAIIYELKCDALIINSSDDRKIETVRDKVKEFAMTKSSSDNKRRCVFMDEFDGMLKASQDALRNIMETYSSNVFFILTCNNLNKVIEPIQSRCVVLPFAYPNKEEIVKFIEKICINEKMDYTEDGIKKLVEINYPSIRNCIISLQDLFTESKQVTIDTVRPVNEIYEEMWQFLKQKNWLAIKKIVMESTIDPRDLNSYFWERSLNEEPCDIKVLQLTCRNEKDIATGSDAKVIFVTSLIELVK
jgi:replication factor C small subunit